MRLNVIKGAFAKPDEPVWTDIYSDLTECALASNYWSIIVSTLSAANALTVANGPAIQRLVEFKMQYDRASRHVAEHGPILRAPKTGVPTTNLNWSVMKHSAQQIMALEKELGIAPTRRKAIKPLDKQRAALKAEQYLTKG